MSERRRIVVAMSGGVDSAVAAAILARDGHEVLGVTLKLPDYRKAEEGVCERAETGRPGCCGVEGIDDARAVAVRLGIPHYVFDYTDRFEEAVVDPFCRAYLRGLTPNPCVECNRIIKFGHLLEAARGLGADFVATGHYSRIERDGAEGRFVLHRGADPAKDQSYFLYVLTQDQLGRILFPLGAMTKTRAREIAAECGLPVASKPGSQDICFVGTGTYADFLRGRYPEAARPGPIRHLDGRTLGRHRGTAFYTVGQRRGLGIAAAEPLYVVRTDPREQTVWVGPREALDRGEIRVEAINWIAFGTPPESVRAEVRIRYRQAARPARIIPDGPDTARIVFTEPVAGVAPGQAAVFYDGDRVLGGGTIAS